MKQSHALVFKQCGLEQLAQHPSKPRKSYQKPEIWSRCFQHQIQSSWENVVHNSELLSQHPNFIQKNKKR